MQQSKRRIALFISGMYGGGAQKAWVNLARGMVENGYPVDLVLASAKGPLMDTIPGDVRVIDLNSRRVIYSLPRLVQYLRKQRPAVLISAMNYVNITALWAKYIARVPTRVIISVHGVPSSSAKNPSDKLGKLMPLFTKLFYPWADEIISVSKGVANDLAQLTQIPLNNIRAIYNPVITPDLKKGMKAPLHHPWFKDKKIPVILAVGRLAPEKDFSTLIKAFALVRQKRPVRLMILGQGQEQHLLEELIQSHNLEQDISLMGFVANPYAYMSRAALFVCSSQWESLSLVLIEALYCGAALVSTDCPYGPREILQGGKFGKLVPVGDTSGLARAIEASLDTPKTVTPREWLRFFELDTVVKQYLAVSFSN